MRILPIILIFSLILLSACVTTDSIQKKNDGYTEKIAQEESYIVQQGAGAAVATKMILEKGNLTDIYTVSAKKTISISVDALPNLTLNERLKWEQIADDLIKGNEESLKLKGEELIQSENKQIELKKKLEEGKARLLDVYARREAKHKEELKDMERNNALKKDLVKYFFYAAAVCVLAGGVLSCIFGFKLGLNVFIAGAFFSLAAYLITQPFFCYLAAGMAIIMFAGTLYFLWGQARPKNTLKRQIKVIERMENSTDSRQRESAKVFKKEMKRSLAESKSEKRHKALVKELKK